MTQEEKKPLELWIKECWLLGSPEMKNYFVSDYEPRAEFHNGAINSYFKVIKYNAYQNLQEENENLKAKLKIASSALRDLYDAHRLEFGIDDFDILMDSSSLGVAKAALKEIEGNG